jgi:Arginase family
MRTLHLHLDDALAVQPALRASAQCFDLVELEARDLGPALRLWTRPPAFAALRARLRRHMTGPGPWLSFAGSGDFHHVSILLMARAIAATGGPVTVIHFDNHPDWVRFARGVHCGSWVARAVRMSAVQRLITVGVCSSDIERPRDTDLAPILAGKLEIYPYRRRGGHASLELGGHVWPTIGSLGEQRFVDLLLRRIPTRDVYVTIDKDALRPADAVTNWDQGALSLHGLADMLGAIAAGHRIIGADVVGDWSAPRYAGVVDGLLKRAESLIDQPRATPGVTAAINEPVNEHLLNVFAGLMA